MESMISTNYMSNEGLNYSSKGTIYSSEEESSWDLYTQDDTLFFTDSAVKKHRYDNDNEASDGSCRVSLTPSYVDQDLEDTASSPDHTPKVNNFNHHQLYINFSKEMIGIDLQEGDSNDRKGEGVSLGGKGRDEDGTELRKKRLCLVPLSLFFDYHYASN